MRKALYLNDLDHQVNGDAGEGAQMVRYADDLVILCRHQQVSSLHRRLDRYLRAKGLSLNATKTRKVNFTKEGFCFLGFQFYWRTSLRRRKRYVHLEPSRVSCKSLRDSIRGELNHWNTWRSSTVAIARVSSIVRGWGNYFHYGNSSRSFGQMSDWLRGRYRRWLWKKHKKKHNRFTYFTNAKLHELPLTSNYPSLW
ncbi:MAG: group II intron maturase-specific domain-containing protein [Opitutales bacterium]